MTAVLDWFLLPMQYPFMQRALIIALITGACCAVLSCFLVLKGWSLMGDAVSHAVLPGMVLATMAGLPLAVGAFVAGLFCAVATGWLQANSRVKSDTVMGIVFSGMFGLGLVLLTKVETDQHVMHILFGNLLGVFPYFFTFNSHIAITLSLSLFVFVLVTVVALREHGLHFFSYFLPKGIPGVLAPLMVAIELISYLSRIISLSVRLFANMMAGHVMLEVFASFIVMLGGIGLLGYFPAGLSLVVNTGLIGFELLVASLQAYVFAVLTCIYLHDAVHLH